MLACWFGNRPPGRSRDWRPVALTCFLWPGLPHTRGGSLERKHQSQPTWMPSLLIGGYLPKPPNPRWIVYAGEASPRKPTRNPLAYLTSENVQSVFFVIIGFQGIWLLSIQKREKGKLSSGRGINGLWAKACGFMPRKPLYCFPFGGYLCCNR